MDSATSATKPENAKDREFSYSQKDFNQVRETLYRIAGIRLADSKDSLVYSRLARRLRALKLRTVKEYLHYLSSHPTEEEHFINALTTNLTSFFREAHHFDALENYLKQTPGIKTIWCAASSTGEEPYSIAMTVARVFGTFTPPVTIIASDIDSNVLNKARAGIYSKDVANNLSQDYRRQFFHKGKGEYKNLVRVVPELRNMVSFQKINLTQPDWPLPPVIDVIFCRNVMIYFDKTTQFAILERMIKKLPAHGRYFAGHSENFNKASHLVEPIGQTIYQPVIGR